MTPLSPTTRLDRFRLFIGTLSTLDLPADDCIRSSLALRDTLRNLGYPAKVKSVALMMRAFQGDTELHSLGVGLRWAHGQQADDGKWDGHVVVVSEGHVIDPMLAHMQRDAWKGALPDYLLAIPLEERTLILPPILSAAPMRVLAGFAMREKDDAENKENDGNFFRLEVMWFSQPLNTYWRTAPATARWKRDWLVEHWTNVGKALHLEANK
jgi:hypothetical protein